MLRNLDRRRSISSSKARRLRAPRALVRTGVAIARARAFALSTFFFFARPLLPN